MVEYRPIDINVDKPQEGDEYFSKDSNKWITRVTHTCPFTKDFSYRRPVNTALTYIPFDGAGQYELMNGKIVNLDHTRHSDKSDDIKCGLDLVCRWVWNKDGTITGLGLPDHSLLYLKRKITDFKNSNLKKEEVMSTNTNPETVSFEAVKSVAKATVRLAGRLVWRGLNYWAFEPVKEITTKVMRAVRYVTLTGVVVGGVYAYNNPEAAKETFWKCLPKIELSVEAPEIMNS